MERSEVFKAIRNAPISGEEIKELRLSMKLSQKQFGQLVGTSQITVHRWETERCRPSRLYDKELKEVKKSYEEFYRRFGKSQKLRTI